ncbi:diacylglycerol kinase [Ancylobacter dichloromethanicus]|uniref:Diacylglycerol kinase n=1 Tax=Ancylobacter dichloromethanicus TaxID=518825 RepID=A0A9W6MYH1_9HYPH|nr:diacylglycerol kinase family protein [Ancylobacter dichloromethanicus]MBS7553842.1 diacylglycerol kinase [Ancylobacter dichloromethanicus]GLK70947.1 diacylglycerol kinase [Ancylobacter dichloromethanicus]
MPHLLVLLNANAGTLLDRDAEEVRALVADGLDGEGRTVEVHLLRGKDLLKAIRGSGTGAHETVIVGGGDGSVSLAVQSLEGTGKTLGILPLGTLNLLATDIGMPRELPAAILALRGAQAAEIDIATLNGRRFHTISGMGFFSQMARARETARRWGLWRFLAVAIAAVYALRRSGRFDLEVTVDGVPHRFDAFAALLSVNRFTGPGWRRSRLDEGVLELTVAEDRGALALLKAGADMVTDNWRDNPGIISLTGRDIVLRRPNRARSWVSTDGELGREAMPLTYRIVPRGLKLLIPQRDGSDPETAGTSVAPASRSARLQSGSIS